MYRSFIFVTVFFISVSVFAQQNSGVRTIGRIPNPSDNRLYQIQVGAFKITRNAERAFDKLRGVRLEPSYEEYLDFTRVVVKGIRAGDVPLFIGIVGSAGFSEVLVKIDPDSVTAVRPPAARLSAVEELPRIEDLPVSTAALPTATLREIAYRSVKIGETRSLADTVTNRNVESWTSSTPSTVSVDSNGNITGRRIGNGYININATEYISVVVVPGEDFYLVPVSEAALLPEESRTGNRGTTDLTEYRTEPTFRLSYRFNNKGENKGASGGNGGIDILGRGPGYEWLWTTYRQGGWFYDLNGVKREMINGYQKDPRNGVELRVIPEFVYDKSVPYLQLRHILINPNNSSVTGQRFGASADVMIHNNDHASLLHTSYGAYMTDSFSDPSLELMFVCESEDGINPVDTLWLGGWYDGAHLNYIYEDRRTDVNVIDSAMGFSYQEIDLAPGETKEFIVRFTLARTEK